MSEYNPWKTVSQRLVHENPWFRVREDDVIRPDSKPGKYFVVETRIATGVVALTAKHEIYLVGQYRYPVDEYSWEIPEGGTEMGEDALSAAKRELREEAGLLAKNWQPLGDEFHLTNCISSEVGQLFLAQDLEQVASEPDATEILQVRCLPFQEALKMVTKGEIKDSITIIALYRAAFLLGYIK